MVGGLYLDRQAARVSGLHRSTTYSYDVLVEGVDLNSGADALTTAPAEGTGTVSFVAFGDSGTGSTAQGQLAALMAADAFDFALHADQAGQAKGRRTAPSKITSRRRAAGRGNGRA